MHDGLLPETVWADLDDAQRTTLNSVAEAAKTAYGDDLLESGEGIWPHAVAMAVLAAENLLLGIAQKPLKTCVNPEVNYR